MAQSSGSQTITGDIADRVLEPGASIPTPEEAAEAALAAAAAAAAIALAGARNPVRDPSRVFKPPSPNVPMSTRDAFAEATSVYETAGLVLPDFIPDDEPLPYVWPRADQEPPPTTPTPADEWASARPVTDRSHAEASSADEPLASPSVDATATDEAVTEPAHPEAAARWTPLQRPKRPRPSLSLTPRQSLMLPQGRRRQTPRRTHPSSRSHPRKQRTPRHLNRPPSRPGPRASTGPRSETSTTPRRRRLSAFLRRCKIRCARPGIRASPTAWRRSTGHDRPQRRRDLFDHQPPRRPGRQLRPRLHGRQARPDSGRRLPYPSLRPRRGRLHGRGLQRRRLHFPPQPRPADTGGRGQRRPVPDEPHHRDPALRVGPIGRRREGLSGGDGAGNGGRDGVPGRLAAGQHRNGQHLPSACLPRQQRQPRAAQP